MIQQLIITQFLFILYVQSCRELTHSPENRIVDQIDHEVVLTYSPERVSQLVECAVAKVELRVKIVELRDRNVE